MAKQMPKKAEESTGDWLNTYADMVTLLLTFFVLLFACSNLDETKLQYIFQAFQMRGKFANAFIAPPNPNASDSTIGNSEDAPANAGGEGEMPQSFDELYQYLSEYVEENKIGESVSIDQGASHITIRFDDNVMFDGDSWVLKNEGRKLLSGFIPAIRTVNDCVQNLTVAGYTAKVKFPVVNDYTLSAMRAVSVQNFLEFNNTVDNEKYIVTGYGPNRPLESNDTEEGRAKNRRVELVLLKAQNDNILNDKEVIKDILRGLGITAEEHDPNNIPKDPDLLPEGSAEKIVSLITGKFEGMSPSSSGYGPGSTDGSEFMVDEEDSEGGSE